MEIYFSGATACTRRWWGIKAKPNSPQRHSQWDEQNRKLFNNPSWTWDRNADMPSLMVDMQAWRAATCFRPLDQLLLDVEHTHTHIWHMFPFGALDGDVWIVMFVTVTLSVSLLHPLTLWPLTRLRCRETFLWRGVRYGSARSCCSSAISAQRTEALTCFTKKRTVK